MTQPTPETTINVARQRFKLRAWVRTRLWVQVIAGMILGFALGMLLSANAGLIAPDRAELVGLWLALPGQIFLALIAMVLVPLIFSSIVGGLNGAGSGEALKSVGLRLASFILVTTTLAAAVGVALAKWFQPGAAIRMLGKASAVSSNPAASETVGPDADASTVLGAEVEAANAPVVTGGKAGGNDVVAFERLPDLIAEILLSNPLASITQGDMLAVGCWRCWLVFRSRRSTGPAPSRFWRWLMRCCPYP